MYTLCSHCDAAYEVSPEALVRGHGQLHCALCERDFDALDRLSRDLPDGIESASIAVPVNSSALHPPEPVVSPISDPDPDQRIIPDPVSLAQQYNQSTSEAPPLTTSDAATPLPPAPLSAPLEDTEGDTSTPSDSRHANLPSHALHTAAENMPLATSAAQDERAVPAIFQWLEHAAAAPRQAAPGAMEPAAQARTDALVDVLNAHADFIEPAHEEFISDTHRDEPADEDVIAEHDDPTPETHAAPDDERRPDELVPILFTSDSGDELIAFPAMDTLSTPLPPDPDTSADQNAHPDTGSTPSLPLEEPADHADPFHPVLDAPTPSFIATPLPVLPPEAEQRRWPAWLAVFALLLSLGLLSVMAERNTLGSDARWRPWLERACATLPCTLAPWHEPAAMQLMTRDVRPHPSVPNALLISASFRNQAPWAQLWPRLDLTLSDLNGRPIAQRQFHPDQYLGMNARESLIQPGQTASVTLEVRDPGKQAVAFEFDFR